MIDDARERQYRKYIKHRDGYECRVCGRGTDLHVHHRIKKGAAKGRDYRYIDVNGLTLCSMCHHMLHNDTEWKKDFDTKYPDEWVLFKIESGEFIEIK